MSVVNVSGSDSDATLIKNMRFVYLRRECGVIKTLKTKLKLNDEEV